MNLTHAIYAPNTVNYMPMCAQYSLLALDDPPLILAELDTNTGEMLL